MSDYNDRKYQRLANAGGDTNASTAMDESHIYNNRSADLGDVVLGVYGTEDWVKSDFVRARHLRGVATIQEDVTWLTKANFGLVEWVRTKASKFTFFSADVAIIDDDDCMIRIYRTRGKIDVNLIGDVERVVRWIKRFDNDFNRAESLVEWVYSTRGDSISVPLSFTPAIESAYPWIEGSIQDFIDDYMNSKASVLVLIGPPGTGKTTFIKNLIHRSGGNAVVAFDEKVMNDDRLFADFIDGDSGFLIMEDADAFLKRRDDGNTMMHKFLNLSDGLISAADKKLVFSTNLPNISDIDDALVRPGRCFATLKFRHLTRDEAKKVIEETGQGSLPDHAETISLAELISYQVGEKTKRKLGFI